MSTERTSLERAMQDEAGENRAMLGADFSAEQLDLLRGPDGALPANAFRIARQQAAAQKGRGRPPGSLNKRSKDLGRLIIHQHGDPVMAMASMYSRPLDQMVELLLIADGSAERQREIDENIAELSASIRDIARSMKGMNGFSLEGIDRLADACEALEAASRRSQGKPGDLAIKALNVQLAAAKAVSEYTHSKKPVEVAVSHKADAVLVFPGAPAGRGFDQLDDGMRAAGAIIEKALATGTVTPAMLGSLRLVDGMLLDETGAPLPDGDDE